MRIILSRKGFDSSNGGCPSPIFPDGRMVSLPIPSSYAPATMEDLSYCGLKLDKVISDLSHSRHSSRQPVHLDPDINEKMLSARPAGWRGAFGQVDIAQRHLLKMGVGRGDLFLFFGWFRQVEYQEHSWRYKPGSPDLHVIYGWLLIDEVVPVFGNEQMVLEKYPWLAQHPHLHGNDNRDNTIYIGSHIMPGKIGANKPGYGVFGSIRDVQILTDTSQAKRSTWKLPGCFCPKDGSPPLSYHAWIERWGIIDDEWIRLRSVGRGQEFVLDAEAYPGMGGWLKELFRTQSTINHSNPANINREGAPI